VARLVPVAATLTDRLDAIRRLNQLGAAIRMTGAEVLAARDEGRR
jgi:hypothetical protein